jgi:uncharacterized repeat protein (TIGR01451 family)
MNMKQRTANITNILALMGMVSSVAAQTDLAVTKTAPPSQMAGKNLTYLLAMESKSLGSAEDVVLSDALPAGTTFVSAMQKSGPPFAGSAPAVGGRGVVKFTADLAPLASESVPDPNNFAVVGNTAFFSAKGSLGRELWKTDGTLEGTVLVKDINPNGDSSPYGFTSLNGAVYFGADDGVHGIELWKTDGTTQGTVLVRDIIYGGGSSYPGSFINVNGTLLFSAANFVSSGGFGSISYELWKSDGTAQGTRLVKDIDPTLRGSSPSELTNVNGTLFFIADDGTTGREIWKSDGTGQGTVLVKDINVNNYYDLAPRFLTNVNGTLFFAATDGASGIELWKSDGTPQGTVLVKNIRPGYLESFPTDLTDVNGTLFFTADNGTAGRELWKSDGTTAGTVLVKDINPGSNGSNTVSSSPTTQFAAVNGTLFFSADDGTGGRELWKSDGTAQGTVLVKDIFPGVHSTSSTPYSSYPYNLMEVNGTLFFRASSAVGWEELWKSDGTAQGTVAVKSFSGSAVSEPKHLTNFNGTLLFAAGSTPVLWKSDGTAPGTMPLRGVQAPNRATFEIAVKVLDSYAGALSNTATVTSVTNDNNTGNNTATATTNIIPQKTNLAISKTAPGSVVAGRALSYALALENQSLNTAYNVTLSDALPPGTTLVSARQTSGPAFSLTTPPVGERGTVRAGIAALDAIKPVTPVGWGRLGDLLIFGADENGGTSSPNGLRLWKTDGTTQGTQLVVAEGPPSNPQGFINAGDKLFFTAWDATHGIALWKTDGTASGTVLVKDLFPGPGLSWGATCVINGTLFFVATNGVERDQLWKSDGTAEGTIVLKETFSNIYSLTEVNGTLFFGTDFQLWKSDGTPESTVLVKANSSGSALGPSNLVSFNGALYFSAIEQNQGSELWKSDGTPEGTLLLKDINPGAASSGPSSFFETNGTLFFTADNGITGRELWKTDGTAQGTLLVKDIKPGAVSSNLFFYVAANGVLIFAADDGTHGLELWKSNGTPQGTTLVKDIWPGADASYPGSFLLFNGKLFFAADDGTHGRELWKTDGTLEGTVLAADIFPGSDGSFPQLIIAINDALFLHLEADESNRSQLWKSDGTAPGTVPVGIATPNSRATFEIVVDVANNATGTLSNTATVISRTPDSDTANNSSTAITAISPPPSLSINDVTITEANNDTTAIFTVSLSRFSDKTITVNAVPFNGTAKAPGDYTSGSAALSFAPGETSKTFSVPVKGDYMVETDETFTVNLSNAVNAVIADGQGIGTITNDDNDVTAPTVRFTTSATTPKGTTPVSGSTIYNAMPVITGTAADAGSGIAKVLLRLYRVKAGTTNVYEYWNGTSWISSVFYFTTTLNPATGGANVSWSKNSGAPTGTDFSDGTYYMVATAYDRANKTAAVSTSFKKLTDNELPTVRFTTSATTPTGTTPVNGSTITGAIPTITGTATDAASGIAKVLLRLYRVKAGTTNVYEYWNGTSWISSVFYFTTTLNPATGGANVSWSKNSGWPTGTGFSDGTYYMVATAYDKANRASAVSSSFKKATVAGLAPGATGSASSAVTLSTAQALAAGQSIKLSFTGALSSTSASQITNYMVRVNGTPVEVQKATYEGASSAVTLQLAAGTLEVGDAVTVSWNLRDPSGQTVNGQTELTVE